MKTFILTTTLLLLSALLPEAAALRAQSSRNTFIKVSVGDIRYVEKAPKAQKQSVGSILTDLATTAVTGKSTTQHDEYAPAVREAIVKALSNVARFRVIDSEFRPDKIADNEEALYVDGTINSITGTSQLTPNAVKGKPAEQAYKVLVNVTLNLKDAHTDEAVDSRIFGITDSDMSWMTSADNALNDAIARISEYIADYYGGIFPLHATIVERGEEKKEKQRTVYIDLGGIHRIGKGQQFDIYILKTIAGREARQGIGRLKVEEVMGDDLSLCKVTHGEKEVKTALDEGKTLVAISR